MADSPTLSVHARFLRFLIVGGLNTAVNYGIYALLVYLGLGYLLAATLSFVAGLVISFKSQRRFVFRSRGKHSFTLFVASWLLIYVIHVSMLGLLVRSGVDSYLAGALLLVPTALLSFAVLRLVVFRERAPAVEQ
jgi:putative flippase GtrA